MSTEYCRLVLCKVSACDDDRHFSKALKFNVSKEIVRAPQMVAPEMFCWLKSWSKESACGKPPGMPDSSSRPDMHIPGWIWLGDLSPQEMEMAVATPHRRWLTPDPARPIRRQDADATSPTPRPPWPPGPRPPRSPLPPPSPLPMAAVVSGRWMPMGNGYGPERPGGSLSEDEFAYPASGTGTGTGTSTGTTLLSSTSTFLQLQVRIYRKIADRASS